MILLRLGVGRGAGVRVATAVGMAIGVSVVVIVGTVGAGVDRRGSFLNFSLPSHIVY
ncbi:MAG: hypothetical protein V1789_07360 [PVC group bacterium]